MVIGVTLGQGAVVAFFALLIVGEFVWSRRCKRCGTWWSMKRQRGSWKQYLKVTFSMKPRHWKCSHCGARDKRTPSSSTGYHNP